MRALVCGGRDYNDIPTLCATMDAIHEKYDISLLINGAASGADYLAECWAKSRNVPFKQFPADWKKHGRSAGPIRNKQMINEGKPEIVVAFPGGRGTADMVQKAKTAGVRVVEIGHSA